jgi:hypothetical protein
MLRRLLRWEKWWWRTWDREGGGQQEKIAMKIQLRLESIIITSMNFCGQFLGNCMTYILLCACGGYRAKWGKSGAQKCAINSQLHSMPLLNKSLINHEC